MDEELGKKIDNNIEDLPEEVSDFIFGEGLEKALKEITDLLETPEQKEEIENDITFYLLGTTSIDEIVEYIDSLTIPAERKSEIKKKIQEKVIDELILIIEANKELEEEGGQDSDADTNISNLRNRLRASSPLGPIKREYSPDMVSPNQTPMVPILKKDPIIDPYHEPVE